MPPQRSTKLKDRVNEKETVAETKKRERLTLAVEIEEMGREMEPCSHCREERRKCVSATEKGDRCSECVRSKRVCDVKVPFGATWESEVPRTSAWESIDRQVELLDDEEEVAAQAAASAMAKQQEAMAKIMRLRKQKALLKDRRKIMLRRGLQYLDELDALEEKERLEQKEAEHRELCAVNLAGSGEEPGHGESSSDLPPLSQQEWQAIMGFVDETPLVSHGS